MGTSLACRVGRHHWVIETRQLDIDEPARTVQVCSACQKINLGGSRFENSQRPVDPNGTGYSTGFGGGGLDGAGF